MSTHKAYVPELKHFQDIEDPDGMCKIVSVNGVPIGTFHMFAGDDPQDGEACQCGQYYHEGALIDQAKG